MSRCPSLGNSAAERVALHLLHGVLSVRSVLRGNTLSLLAILLFTSLYLKAAPLTWTLHVTFADGGVAAGVFTFDSDTNTISNWNISATGGNTSVFFPFTFTPGNSYACSICNSPLRVVIESNAQFPDSLAPMPEMLALQATLASPMSDSGGTIAIVPGNTSAECFVCNPYRLITSGTVTAQAPCLMAPPTLPPGDLFCACGVNGPGNIYDPTISYCASGVVVPNGDLFCSAGVYGPGSIYDPTISTCVEGVSVPSGDLFCSAGIYGPGNIYDPTISTCDEGVSLPSGDSYCPAGANGSGGFYDPATEGCNLGSVTSLGALPPVIPPNQIATTASGLTYNRVNQTFNGTITLSNIGSNAIRGPLQILFTGLTSGVTLVNASGSLSGSSYLSVSASLAPGQSVTLSAQFQNPSRATINFTPVIYSGRI